MGTKDISTWGLVLAYLVVLGSFFIFYILKIGLYWELLAGLTRMGAQLFLVGLYLSVIFKVNSLWLNVGYILLMLAVANYSLLKGSGLRLKLFSVTLPPLVLGIGGTLAYYTVFVFKPEPLYDARYLIPIAGMLLGNSMTRIIITLERFYSSIRRDHEGYASLLTMGATLGEAILPYLRTAYRAGISPSLARMATIGIVFLPGMMTGQILGGTSPIVAVKYQIAIILAIFVATEICTLLVVYFSLRKGFDELGFVNMNIFKDPCFHT